MELSELQAEMERLHPACYGWALSCCSRQREEAEDVLQTAYLKILQGKARYDGRSAFKTWLFAVIRRTAADARRTHFLRRLRIMRYEEEARAPLDEGGSAAATGQPAVEISCRDASARRFNWSSTMT